MNSNASTSGVRLWVMDSVELGLMMRMERIVRRHSASNIQHPIDIVTTARNTVAVRSAAQARPIHLRGGAEKMPSPVVLAPDVTPRVLDS